jgi:hypothetical protein
MAGMHHARQFLLSLLQQMFWLTQHRNKNSGISHQERGQIAFTPTRCCEFSGYAQNIR